MAWVHKWLYSASRFKGTSLWIASLLQEGRPFKPFCGIYPFMDPGHSWYPVPASLKGVSLIHLATDRPALPSLQAFHPSQGTPGRDLVGLLDSPVLPGSVRH